MKTRIFSLILCVLMLVSMMPVSVSAAEVVGDVWDGTADTSWYNATATSFTLTTAEQLAGLASLVDGGNSFAGKTVKLGADIDLGLMGDDELVSFNPIGDAQTVFEGTFDGQNHTISNLYQSGWAFGIEWGSAGPLGLFGYLYNATVKNLTISGAEIFGEAGNVGGISGYAGGNCSFENITISNSLFASYNNRCGGLVGWTAAGAYSFENIKVDQDTVISGMWGSFDASLGGIMGQLNTNATASFTDVIVECRMDAYNDVTASYQYYAYRMCGMLIGRIAVNANDQPDPAAAGVVCNNVTVTYGDWANYTYCHFSNMGSRYVRVQPGYNWGAYYHSSTWSAAVDAAGNPVTSDNHAHADGEIHNGLLTFDQLFGGTQYGSYGKPDYTGVDVHYLNAADADENYTMQSDAYGHWYSPKGSNVKLLYAEHYDIENPELVPGEDTHYHVCDECGAAFDHHAHTPKAGWEKDASGHWHVCLDCGGRYAFAAHTESDWIIDTDAEIGVEGEQHKECTVCGHSPLSTEIIPAKEQPVDYVLFALAARYAQRFDVLVSAENATVTGDVTIKYKRNGTVNIDVAEGYQLVDVIANGQSLGAVTSVTFKKVMTPQTLVVVTEPIPTEEPAVEPAA